ncbi:hypothetical protein OSTOST_24090 [Ostertagia ostertagi]
MRGELHFYLRRRDAAKSGRARQLRAKSLCVNDYCSENQQLETIKVSPEKVVWDATKPLAEANALDTTQLVVRISRRDIRMRRYVELVKKCSPFLLVYSKADNTINTEKGTRRKRRELGYFSYNAVESTSEAAHTSTERFVNGVKAIVRHSKRKGPMPRRKKVRGSRTKSPEDDIWHGFGDDPPTDEEKKEKNDEKSNDVRVVSAWSRRCVRNVVLLVDLKQLGWGRWVIAPAEFEAGFCSGICPNPLPKVKDQIHNNLRISLKWITRISNIQYVPTELHI